MFYHKKILLQLYTKNYDVSTELHNGINKLQIESDHIKFDGNVTIEKVNIQNQTKDDIHK